MANQLVVGVTVMIGDFLVGHLKATIIRVEFERLDAYPGRTVLIKSIGWASFGDFRTLMKYVGQHSGNRLVVLLSPIGSAKKN